MYHAITRNKSTYDVVDWKNKKEKDKRKGRERRKDEIVLLLGL